MLADGKRGPLVHELIDELEAAGDLPAVPAPTAPAGPPRLPTPSGGTQ
jgi:hypothetical protein